ncbi:hypothetical protein C4J81_16465 [Deltaproteobacteria bacterium Smac51]|nr:hypothetical protein C4J81_16465 [Deltaproteobacteria bacterium Smac51]
MKAKDVIKKMKKEGWILKKVDGSHHQFIHPDHPEKGKVTVPLHNTDILKDTLARIKKQTGLDF